jgi:4-amino-4-deoxy-L-arabinose transferase-like glycosyltransferase
MLRINVRKRGALFTLDRAIPFVLVFPIAAIYLLLLSANWKPTWDSATYIMLGKSLITGRGFKYMDIPHTKYPFMFPLMLSPIIGLFGRNFLLMRLLIVLMALGSIGLTFWLFRRDLDTWLGLGITIMTAASYPLMNECTRILSDIPYMFLSLLSLIFIGRYARDEKWLSKSGYICAALILASFFTRYIGLALFAGGVIYLLLDSKGLMRLRSKKIALISAIFLIPASLWMMRGVIQRRINPPPSGLREFLSYEKELVVASAGDPHSRTLGLESFISRVRRNNQYYQDLTADIVSGKNINSRRRAQIISITLLCGFIYCLIRWRGIFEYYVFFYVLTYILWTSLQGTRFLVPIIPFILYYLVRALWLIPDSLSFLIKRLVAGEGRTRGSPLRASIWGGCQVWVGRFTLAALAALLIYCNWSSDVNTIRKEHRKPYYTGSTANFLKAIGWIKENTSPDAMIVSDRAPWVHMLSDRKALTFPWVGNTREVMASIRRNSANYVIVSPVGGYALKFLLPVLNENPGSFLKVYESGDCAVYRVVNAVG